MIKDLAVRWGYLIVKHFPDKGLWLKIKRKFQLAKLYRDDIALYRVEIARQMGAKVGENCRFYSLNFFSEPYLIEIGNDVIISGEVIFITHDGGVYLFKDQIPNLRGYYGKIKIGNNCFIGMGAIILPNVEIGNNCIVGAGAVVTQSFPDNSVIMGNPAKVAFKTDMYFKLRKYSKQTVLSEKYPFPTRISDNEKRLILEEKLKNITTMKARLR